MNKRILSVVLTLAMVLSMFAGLATTASAAEPMTLTFALNANPGGWPTANSTTTTNYTYTLDGVDYTFALKNVKCNSGYLMLTQPAAFGLPAISGYKLTKVVANNSSGCSTSVNVGVSSSDSSASYISGGDAQKWATTSSSYTYNLTDTADNTMYYLYATTKNAQIISLELTYDPVGDTSCEHANVTDVEAVAATCTEVGYTAGVFCTDCQTYISGHETIATLDHAWDEGVETLAATCTAAGEMTYTCTVCGATKTEATPLAAHNYVDNVCSVCGTVDPTSVDYTGLYYISVDNTYMTSNLTTGSTQRYEAVATGLAEGESLPASITLTAADEKTFSIEKQEDGSYVIRAASVDGDNYLTYVSNAGNIGAADAAIKVSIVEANGIFTISNETVDTATRYLAKNNTAANMYYGWYKSGQHDTLSLIPVTIDAEAHVHTYAWDGNVGVDGSHTLVCECGEASMQEACADAEPVHTAGDCQNYGSTAYTCDVCGYTWTVADTELGDHNYVDGICTVCGAEEPADVYYEPLTAAPADWTGTYLIGHLADGAVWIFNGTDAANDYVSATPAEDGKIVYADGMAVVTIAAVEGGYTLQIGDNYMYSSGSANGLTLGTTANANALEFTADGVVITYGSTTFRFNATSGQNRFRYYKTTTTGTAYTYPTLYKLVEQAGEEPVDPVDCQHTNATEVAEVPATCTTAGNSAYWSCPDCGKYFSDAACTTETTLEAVTIAATGHTPTAYTSNNDGTHAYTCSVCNETVTENCTAEEVETIPATCTSYSSTDYECPVCGGAWTVIGTEYAPHNYENGVCSVCGDALDKYVKVTDLSTLAAGDTVVIYYPASNMALTSTAYGSKLAGVAGQIDTTGNGMMYVDGATVMTVAINEAGQYQFSIVDAESNTLYLTAGATGNSLTFAAAPAEGETDYTLWTIVADTTDSTIAYIKSVNAVYNSTVQALEYYNGFTTYGEKTTAAYQFNFYKPYVEGEHIHSYTSEVTTAATCLTDGLMTYTCACGDSYTEAIPATGHSYAADAVAGTACANGCGHTLIEAKKTVALEDGMTVIFYSANISMAMDTVANGTYLNAIAPNTAAGDTLLIDDGVALMTVEVVEGGYRFKLGDNYLSYRGGRNTLVFEPLTDAVVTDEEAGTTTDYTVFALENGNALYCVNGDYDYNGNVNKLYLEAYGDHYTSYNCSDNTGAAFVFTFYTTSEVCNHVADEGTATTPATCTTAGVMTYTCTICGETLYTAEIPATGHNYVDGVCTNCGEAEPNFEGDWYIAVARSSGNYYYMENTMQNTAGTRFTAVDSGLTTLPEAITEDAMAEYVFHIAKNADGNYVMYSNYVEGDNKYVGWNVGSNTATLVAEADARAFTVIVNEDGTVILSLVLGEGDGTDARYLSLNGTSGNDYFAWYKNTQRYNLTLIPVSGEIHVHSYTVSDSVDATCTTDGSVTYTCSCGKTYTETVPATGHTIEAVEAVAATCTTDGNDAYYKCSVCGALFSDAEGTTALDAIPTVSATGHTEVTDAAVAATCTTTGLTEGSHCSVCGVTIVVQETVAALGHSYTYVDNGDGTHTATCSVCNDTVTADHTFVDGTCVCGATEAPITPKDENLQFLNVSLSLQECIQFTYMVKYTGVLNNYSSYYVAFSRNDFKEGLVENQDTGYQYSTKYHCFTYNVWSMQMNDEITATLYGVKDGVVYEGETKTYSVRSFAESKFAAATEAQKTVYANMLQYGAMAQINFAYDTENLANANLDASITSYITSDVPSTVNQTAATSNGLTGVTLAQNALGMQDAVKLQYILSIGTNNVNDLYAVATWVNEKGETVTKRYEGSDFISQSKYYVVIVDGLTAVNGKIPVNLTVYDSNDNAVSETFTYSIQSYVNVRQNANNNTTAKINALNLSNAMMNYYNSCEVLFG